MPKNWTISGEYVECCNCSVPCQCLWHEAPDNNVCNAGVFWNIEEGTYDDVSLDGLTAGFLVDQEGVLFEGGWDVVFILDEAADGDQADALETIFLGQAGGLFEALASAMVEEVVDVVSLPFEYSRESDHFEFEAGDIASMVVDGSHGLHDQQGTVFPHPLVGDQEINLGKSTEWLAEFNDEFSWNHGGNNAYFGDFAFESA